MPTAYAQWYTWNTAQGPLTITFPNQIAINSIYLPSYDVDISIYANNILVSIAAANTLGSVIPLPTGTVQVELTAASTNTYSVYATSQPFSPSGGSGGSGQDLGLFIPEAYGAFNDNAHDDTVACQAAINAAEATGVGGTVAFLTGSGYMTSAPLVINQPNQITLMGFGDSSQILATGDYDVIYVPSTCQHGTGFSIQNLNIQFPNGGNFDINGLPVGINGAAINIGFDNYGTGIHSRNAASLTDTVIFHVFTNNTGYGMKFQAGGGRNVSYGCKYIGNYVGFYMYGHGMKFLGDTINGGTYGLVADGGADPKIFEVPFFGCLSVLSMNTSGSYKGGTFYIFDGEGNFGPPPGIGIPPYASGYYVLTAAGGGPTTGNTHYLIIDGYYVPCPETTGTINNQTLLDIGFVNTFFSNPANFPDNPGDLNEVAASPDPMNLNHVVITATTYGYSGNDIKINFQSSATVTVTHSGNKLSGGSQTGVFPGDPFDMQSTPIPNVGYLATQSGLTVGCGGYLIGGDHAQCNIIVNWVKDGIVIGDVDTTGPGYVDIIGGNIGASSKGKSQITTHAIDIQNVGQAKISEAAISQGGSVSGAAINLPAAAFASAGIHINDNRFKIGNGNYAINGVDNTADVVICDNEFAQGQGTVATGGYIQQGGVTSGPPLGNTSVNKWTTRANRGFNPFTWLETLTTPTAPSTTTYTNNYGMPAGYYLGGGGGVTVSILKPDGTFISSPYTSGYYRLEPGAQIKVAVTSGTVTIQVSGE